jgi:L-amino acid N-acyltransferase YncA
MSSNSTSLGQLKLRFAAHADAPELLAIYRPVVESSATSFELIAPDLAEFAARIEKANHGWRWLVAERGGRCVGYAYGSAHRERAAYRWSVEVSAYVHPNHHREGIGRALYLRLFEELAQIGFCHAYAGITLPNIASIALHRNVGFEPVGIFKSVGRKFDRWHDVAWFQRTLRDLPPG